MFVYIFFIYYFFFLFKYFLKYYTNKTEKMKLEKKTIVPHQDEVQIILKNIKMKSKLIDKKISQKEEMRKKAEEREKKAEKIREQNELLQKEKLNRLKQKQRDKEINKIEKELNKIKPKVNNSSFTHELIFGNKDEKLSNKINVFSANRRNKLEKIKTEFYNQNEEIKLNHKIDEDNTLNFHEVKKELNINELEKKVINNPILNKNNIYNEENDQFKTFDPDDDFVEIVEGYKKDFDIENYFEKKNNYPFNYNSELPKQQILPEKGISKDKEANELSEEYKKFKKLNNIQLDNFHKKNKIEIKPKYNLEKIDNKIEELEKLITRPKSKQINSKKNKN